jgi:hypothetical protein
MSFSAACKSPIDGIAAISAMLKQGAPTVLPRENDRDDRNEF